MLREEQVAELLRRCESAAGRTLTQSRGNLRKASTRAAAVWELLFYEAAAQLGRVEGESPQGGPDVRLKLPTGRWVSIEVTYLHRRFDDDNRKSEMVARWMHDAAAAIGPFPPQINCQFGGDSTHPAGPKRTLPQESDRRRFLASAEVAQFLHAIKTLPKETHTLRLTKYSITLTASPHEPGSPGFLGWGGLEPEAPKAVGEHAAYRALREKLKQHKVDEPHLVCIGSDVSPVLTNAFSSINVGLDRALDAAVQKSGKLSGVLVVNIESAGSSSWGNSRLARCTAYPVPNCRYPLNDSEWDFVKTLDLNRWRYTFPLSRRESSPQHRHRNIPGPLGYSPTRRGSVKLTIPASVLTDVLAGRRNLMDEYGGPEGQMTHGIATCLANGWTVVACSFQEGDVQTARAASVLLELAPPHDPVFWPLGPAEG